MTELEMLKRICTAYEDELKKRMPPEEFDSFTKLVAKALFAEDIMNMADGDFKECCLDNFKELTGSDEVFQELLKELDDTKISIEDTGGGD